MAVATLALGVSLTACTGVTNSTPVSGSNGQTTEASSATTHAPNPRSTNDPAGNKSIDGTSQDDQPTMPGRNQPGNPCTLADSGSVFGVVYGGTWKQESPDNPSELGLYKKRVCVFSGQVPGAYSGTPGVPVPVKVAVVTYLDDTNGTLYDRLVSNAKAQGAYAEALPNNDGIKAGDGPFYAGQPGFCPLTSLNPLDHALIVQVVPIEDKYNVLVDDPQHNASLVDSMVRLLNNAAPKI